MRLYAAGSAQAFDRLYRRHEAATWRFIVRQVGSEAVANDVMQETWFSVARNAHTWQPNAKFSTWLFTIARNKIMDFFRAQRGGNTTALVQDEGESSVPDALIADSILGPLRQVQSKQLAQALLSAVEQLPTDQRETFLMQANSDLSIDEIAAITEVSFETAKSRLRYARNKLKSVLKDFEP